VSKTEYHYDTNLDEFVSDYYQLDNAKFDSNFDIAVMYIEAALDPAVILSDDELKAEAARLIPQIAYLRPSNHPIIKGRKRT
jgi:hypothetical protein